MNCAYIIDAVRTAGARRGGRLAGWHPADLGGAVLDALLDRTRIDPAAIEDVVLGCVSQAGEQSSNLARGVVLASRLPESVPAVTIDRQCGSSQQALHFAAQAVMSGMQDVVIAAGVESMTRVPMGSPRNVFAQAGLGIPMSPRQAARYPNIVFSQFAGAEMMAKKYAFNRADLDAFALMSHQRAAAARDRGDFNREIIPLPIGTAAAPLLHERDEGIRAQATLASIGAVELLEEGGVITAANASQVCDGAAAALVVSENALQVHGLKPLARIHTLVVTAGDPVIMLEEPIRATRRALHRAGLGIADIDLYEVNEAFAPVPMAWLNEMGADPERLNVNGGAIALGHPLGATGIKLMSTLLHALKNRNKRFGLQTMCEGGGLANVTIVECLQQIAA